MPFIPIDGPLHRADVTFLNLGKNDIQIGLTAEDVIKRTDASYDWLSPLVKRVIVMGQFSNVGTPVDSVIAAKLKTINNHCAARYGRQFFNLSAYLSSAQVWADTGITPTSSDLAQQAMGNLAPSLSLDNVAHMNATARAAVAQQLKAMIIGLGWY
jgi:erythromycin esterase-like protein